MSSIHRSILCLLLLGASPPNEGGEFGWACFDGFHVGNYSASTWRFYQLSGGLDYYQMKFEDAGSKHYIYWGIAADPGAPSSHLTPEYIRVRSEAASFVDGPQNLNVSIGWHGAATGPIWAYYWGDGRYVGGEMQYTARQVRKMTAKDGQVYGSGVWLGNSMLLKGLAPADEWTVALVDATGKELFRDSFRIPGTAEAEAAYRQSRARIDAVEQRFRVDHEMLVVGSTLCEDEENPLSTI